jgi:hypothetical protein
MRHRSREWSRWLLLLSMLLLVPGCGRERIKEAPPELLGVWRTDHPDYRDRYMEIRPREIVFGTGAGTSATYLINRLRLSETESRIDYTIYYDNEEGQEYAFSIIYEYQGGGQIMLPNQRNMVWRRSPAR